MTCPQRHSIYARFAATFLSLVISTTAARSNENSVLETGKSQPNVLFILADDLGWNDVGWNNPDIQSPNIDALASSGVTLTQAYVQPVCSPSRSALMTGYFPFRTGFQHSVLKDNQDVCLPDQLILPELLKQNGYATHMLGKWHLGHCKWECTPTYRGFDSHYGYFTSGEDYYTKDRFGRGFDFRSNKKIEREAAGNYSTFQYSHKTVEIIHEHNHSKPLFIYLALQSVHYPLQVPDEYVDLYTNISVNERRILSGMVTAMDDAIGEVVVALKESGLYNNTIIIFSSDNGGNPGLGGNNYPLRGTKSTLFEGGTRVPAFVHSPLLANPGQTYAGMLHIVDWLPTIAEAVGMNYTNDDQDGVSQWSSINSLGKSSRDFFIYNIDMYQRNMAAIRMGDYKLILGSPGNNMGWYRPEDIGPTRGPRPHNQQHLRPANSTARPEVDMKLLFDLANDPEERVNLYSTHPDVVKQLENKLTDEMRRYVAPHVPPPVPAADPGNFGGVFSPGWC